MRRLSQKINYSQHQIKTVSYRSQNIILQTIFILFELFLVLYRSYYLPTKDPSADSTETGEFDDISLNNKPEKQLSCRYPRKIDVDSELSVPNSITSDNNVMRTGQLKYTATVVDPTIGRDAFTEVVIAPDYPLVDIYAM